MSTSKCVVVIGGSSGIGRATAMRFAHEGWRVAVAAPDYENVRRVGEELDGSGHLLLELDITLDDQVESCARRIAESFGHIDALVNSAGISEPNHLLDSDFTAWNRHMEVMLYGNIRTTRALAPLLNNGGRIINITSIHHERVARNFSSYAMAKAAITQFTRSLAVELADRGILANAIAPGFVETPMSYKNGRNELESEWFLDNYVKYDHLPLKRAARPEEIAGVAWFLAGPDSTYLTGSVLTVDGGLTITF